MLVTILVIKTIKIKIYETRCWYNNKPIRRQLEEYNYPTTTTTTTTATTTSTTTTTTTTTNNNNDDDDSDDSHHWFVVCCFHSYWFAVSTVVFFLSPSVVTQQEKSGMTMNSSAPDSYQGHKILPVCLKNFTFILKHSVSHEYCITNVTIV